jgi:PAS domain S-box-containing protein
VTTRPAGGLIQWLNRIPDGDPLERRHAVSLQVFALVLCFGIVALESVRLIWGFRRDSWIPSVTNLTDLAISLLTVLWIRRGHYRRASWTFVAGFSLVQAVAISLGGLEFGRDAVKNLATVLALVALLLGRRALWIVLLVLITALATAYARDLRFLGGTGPHPAPSGLAGVFWISTFTFVILALVLDRFGLTVREAFADARARERQLEDATSELLAANRALEAEVLERQRVAEELRNSQELLRVAFQISPYAILITRLPDTTHVMANHGFTALTGYSEAEVIGRDSVSLQLWVDLSMRAALFERLTREVEVRDFEARFRRKDGSEYAGKLSAHTFVLGKVPHLLTVTRDVTAARSLEAEREKLRGQLVEAQKMEAVGTLAGGIAHDFNNIISVIQSYAQLAGQATPAGSSVHEDLEQIADASRRAAGLVRQLLAFSRRQVVRPRAVDLGALVVDTRRLLERVLPADIVLRTSVAEGVPNVLIDPGQIEQVVMNLSVNARDAMPRGGVLEISTKLEDGLVALIVRDTGSGIPRELQEKIFEPFFTTKAPGQGTGLGLATCYGIVRQAGGRIEVHSEPGKGTTFQVLLPPLVGLSEPAPPTPVPSISKLPTGSETILFVEDEPQLREATARMLRSLGYRVLAAADARLGLALARETVQPIPLLITDVMMPGMRGTELAEILGRERPACRTLFISGYADMAVMESARTGLTRFLGKPFSMAELAAIVRRLLDAR